MRINDFRDIEGTSYFKRLIRIIQKGLNDQIDDFVKQSGFFPYWRAEKAYGSKNTPEDVAADVEKNLEALTFFIGIDEVFDVFMLGANDGGKSYIEKSGINGSFRLTNPALIKRIKERQDFLIGRVDPISGRLMGRGLLDKTTIEWISGVLTQGILDGKGNKEIAKELLKSKKIINKHRAEMIANAEISNSIMNMEFETATRNGSQKKQWDTAGDSRVSEGCRENGSAGVNGDGWIPVYDAYPSGHLISPRFPRCRCVMQYSRPPSTEAFWLGE